MFGAAMIVFRESLEAALLIGIIAASTKDLPYRGRWIGLGVLMGILGALGVATITEVIANMADGIGQELFNAGILGVAVLMIAWHNIWMASHGREMAGKAKGLGADVVTGKRALSAIAIAIALTVLREGSEAALFIQGLLASATESAAMISSGALLGLLSGTAIGAITYFGLLRIPLRTFFTVTGSLLLFLAAGLAGQMAKFLVQADYLPALVTPLWDSSWLLPADSLLGSILAIFFGYTDQPSGMQVIFYGGTLMAIKITSVFIHRRDDRRRLAAQLDQTAWASRTEFSSSVKASAM